MNRQWIIPAAAVAAIVTAVGGAQAQSSFPDIDPNHWAYQSVQDLARDGLVLGYPDGNFLGARTLTRYEAATLIKRVVDNINGRIQKLQQSTAPDPTPVGPAAIGVTPEQLARVQRLTEEFKTELAVIGTDLATLKTRVAAVEGSVAALDKRVTGTEDSNRKQQAAIDTINRKKIDGYIQARYARRATDSGAIAPQGIAQDVNRSYASGNQDTFNVRRARFNIRGDITDRTAYKLQLETGSGSGSDTVTIKDIYVSIKDVLKGTPLAGVATADAWLGKSNNPFGYNLNYSTPDRLAPERYIAFSEAGAGLFPAQDFDTGAALRGKLANRYAYHVGIYNGNGSGTNDVGRRKDFIGRIGVPLASSWSLGISGYDGEGNTPLANPAVSTSNPTGAPGFQERRRVKSLLGVDSQIRFGPAQLNVEYVRGKGGLLGSAQSPVPSALRPFVDAATIEGGYAELGYRINPKLTLAGAYEYFNRNADPNGSFSGLSGSNAGLNGTPIGNADFKEERFHFGAHYLLDAATRLRLWYEAPLNYPNLPGGKESVARTGQYTAEVQVKF